MERPRWHCPATNARAAPRRHQRPNAAKGARRHHTPTAAIGHRPKAPAPRLPRRRPTAVKPRTIEEAGVLDYPVPRPPRSWRHGFARSNFHLIPRGHDRSASGQTATHTFSLLASYSRAMPRTLPSVSPRRVRFHNISRPKEMSARSAPRISAGWLRTGPPKESGRCRQLDPH